ncbi:protein kilB [Candidatus Frankia nodulisporulans]|uniref:protein kilB n=1 Tax=Candidatus Frankia nodulisporulans TaxID=2060052 RepID=UPI0013D40F4C|nr:protein kilB [Candidatus Frankia nodulisporulans]
MDTLIGAAVALVGTLLGAAGQWAAGRSARRAADTAARTSAVAALVAALAAHRRAMWIREDARLGGADPDRVAALRADSHASRDAITAPLTTVLLLAPGLAEAARTAAAATYALRHAPARADLARLRDAALAAEAALVATASTTP